MAQEEERTMKVQIVSIEFDANLTNAAGKTYQGCAVVYKNEKGDVNDKKMHNNTFRYNKTLKAELESLNPKDWAEITSKKEGEYVNWVSAKKIEAPAESAPAKETAHSPASSADVPTRTQVKSNYETPEERAARQVMIVRQSSLERALQLAALVMKTGNGFVPTEEDIIESAKVFEAYVMGTAETTEPKMPE